MLKMAPLDHPPHPRPRPRMQPYIQRMHSRTNDKLLLGTISLGFAPSTPSSTYPPPPPSLPRNHGSFLTPRSRFANIAVNWTAGAFCMDQSGQLGSSKGESALTPDSGGAFKYAWVGGRVGQASMQGHQ